MAKKGTYEKEVSEAVKTLMATLRSIADMKARQYKRDFLLQVRDEINEEIKVHDFVDKHSADMTALQVEKQLNGKVNEF